MKKYYSPLIMTGIFGLFLFSMFELFMALCEYVERNGI